MITADDWENTLRPSLRGMPRAIYAPAPFIRCADGVLTVAVPNAVHLAKCEEHRTAVEQMLSTHAGVAFTVALVDSGGGGGGGGRSDGGGADRATTAPMADRPRDAAGDAGGAASGPASGSTEGSDGDEGTVVEGAQELPDDDDVDLDDLVDAPPESVKTPIDRLAEAFPGSELIEEAG